MHLIDVLDTQTRRRSSAPLLTVLVSLALACIACEEANQKDLTTSSAAIATFQDDYAVALCELNRRCELGMLPVEDPGCAVALSGRTAYVSGSALASNQQLDNEAANRCISALQSMSCEDSAIAMRSDTSVLVTDCAFAVRGVAAQGEACQYDIDCGPGLGCLGTGEELCGECVPTGGRCPDDSRCAAGQWCDDTNTCHAPVAAGAACTSSTACGEAASCLDGVCTPRGGIGEACDLEGARCLEGLSCQEDASGATRCVAPTLGLAEGESCESVLVQCGTDLRCAPDTATCVRRAAIGEPCSGSECVLGAICEAGSCAVQRDNGEACATNEQCLTGFCDGGACSHPAREAMVCTQ